MENIEIGDYVRAFDFDCRDLYGRNACFTEGIVEAYSDEGEIRRARYVIKVKRDVWAGQDVRHRVGYRVYPAANGRMIYPANKFMNNVEVVQRYDR